MTTIEEQIKELMPRLTEEVAAQIRQRALSNLEYTVSEAVVAEVKKYVADAIVPTVRAELAAKETEIRASVIAAITLVAEEIGKTLVEQAKKKLNGYDGDKLIKEVFGPMFRGY